MKISEIITDPEVLEAWCALENADTRCLLPLQKEANRLERDLRLVEEAKQAMLQIHDRSIVRRLFCSRRKIVCEADLEIQRCMAEFERFGQTLLLVWLEFVDIDQPPYTPETVRY